MNKNWGVAVSQDVGGRLSESSGDSFGSGFVARVADTLVFSCLVPMTGSIDVYLLIFIVDLFFSV